MSTESIENLPKFFPNLSIRCLRDVGKSTDNLSESTDPSRRPPLGCLKGIIIGMPVMMGIGLAVRFMLVMGILPMFLSILVVSLVLPVLRLLPSVL